MIPVPEAQAAYSRVTRLQTQAGDLAILSTAAAQPGMPVLIVELGSRIKTSENAHSAYLANPSEANADTWLKADSALRDYCINHLALPAA